jgi:glycogen operon protein
MTGFVARLTTIRRRFPQIRARRWVVGRRSDGSYDMLWLTPRATEMVKEDWEFPEGRFLAYVLAPSEPGGEPIYIVLNAAPEPINFILPKLPEYSRWTLLLNSAATAAGTEVHASGSGAKAPPRAVMVFAGAA